MNRACLGYRGHSCGVLIPASRRRCPGCTTAWERRRVAQRGNLYSAHRREAKDTVAEQGWCSECGATTDLTADHVVPGDPDSPLRTLCRSCNSARANRARRNAHREGASHH